MDENELVAPFARLLEDVAAPARTRGIEASGKLDDTWDVLVESGFLDALAPEEAGGFELPLSEVAPLLQALGRHAVAAPVGETMVARALLAQAGVEAPSGPIVLATLHGGKAAVTPLARVAEFALVQEAGRAVLTPLAGASVEATGVHHGLAASLAWNAAPSGPAFDLPAGALRACAAVIRACAIAGAADRLLELTVEYANARVQFGKPIGKQQAIQQQLAVMAEETVAARIAAQIGCASGLPPETRAAAVAKFTASRAAPQIAATAHAVHGAIGISEEYDLQLFTRRLHEWRLADGSETYWAELLGAERQAQAASSSVDFIREIGAPA